MLGAKQTKREVTISAGTTMVAALQTEVSTKGSQPGNSVELRTVEPIRLEDGTTIPEGLVIRGSVTAAEGGGRVSGAPELGLEFNELEVDGRAYPIRAESFYVQGKSDATESAAEIGGGAVAGTILGGVLGGGDDAVKGAVIGAAIGTGVAVATEGEDLYLHDGQKLKVRLADAVTVEFKPAPEGEETEG